MEDALENSGDCPQTEQLIICFMILTPFPVFIQAVVVKLCTNH